MWAPGRPFVASHAEPPLRGGFEPQDRLIGAVIGEIWVKTCSMQRT
jgi:hypothetical protein